MGYLDLKDSLHEAIEDTQDEYLLQEALDLLKSRPKADWWDELTPEQKKEVKA